MNPNIPYFRNFPDDFRKDVIQGVLSAVRKGQNVQLIGLKGSGKSQIFRFMMANSSILKEFNVVQIDFNLIFEKTASAISKILLDNLTEWEKSPDAFNKKTIILADSFENITDILDTSLVRVFEGLVNRHREFVSFVFSINKPIESGNPFWGEQIYITPLLESDFEWFWKGLGGESDYKKEIYKASGGHVATIKRLFEIISLGQNLDEVIKNPRINPHLLYQLELMKEDLGSKQNYFDVPIYNTFLNGVTINNELTALENKAFQFLIKNKGVVVDREKLIEAIWGEHATGEVADHALDQLMHRLKIKVAKDNYKIETLRGRGHRLI